MTLSIFVALKKKFFLIRLSLWGAFSPKYIDTYLNCIFTIQGVPKNELSHISHILANFIAFSILLDTLYGENTLLIMVYMYLIQEAPKRKTFFVKAAIMINVIYFNV